MKWKNYLATTIHTMVSTSLCLKSWFPLSSPPPWETRARRIQIKPGWWNTGLRYPEYPARGLAMKVTTIRPVQTLMSLQKIKNLSGCW
jgi:hypothetical protein